jgi:hypothetical protein
MDPERTPSWHSWDSPVGLGLFLTLTALAAALLWRAVH